MFVDNPYISNLRDAVIARDADSVRYLLDNEENVNFYLENGDCLLHLLVKVSARSNQQNTTDISRKEIEKKIVYMLSDAGIDVNYVSDKVSEFPLLCAVQNNVVHLCDVLLQCGANMHALTMEGISILETVYQLSSASDTSVDTPPSILQTFQKYQPGLFSAVAASCIADVRRLMNMWCKTDLKENGKTLRELAIENGNEEIMDLILGAHSTMKLVHHILARNTRAACRILTAEPDRLQLNIRNMSNNGAPILFYAICDQDAELVKQLVDKGSRVYLMMRDADGYDLPVLFTAIKPNVGTAVVKALLPQGKPLQEELLYRLLYKGKNILEVAVERQISGECFSVLIDRGGPMLLACRNKLNQTIEDVALLMNYTAFQKIIKQKVTIWLSQPESFLNRRKILAVWGYDWKSQDEEIDSTYLHAERFLEELPLYQEQIDNLKRAVEMGDEVAFEKLCVWSKDPELFECNLAWYARMKGDGLPLLHRAVLHNRPQIVKIILEHKPQQLSVDSLLDQFHRTALHYAYGIPEAEEIRRILLVSGCSEHTLDKNGYEPLDFKIKQNTEEMEAILSSARDNILIVNETDWHSECSWNTKRREQLVMNQQEDTCEMEAANLQYTIRCVVL